MTSSPPPQDGEQTGTDVSLIVPVYNAALWLDECLTSVFQQDFGGSLEISIYNDSSTDNSISIIHQWKPKLQERGIRVIVGGHDSERPRGVGHAKNQAIHQSSGRYLCFMDADDVMMPQRVRLQYDAAQRFPNSIIGCRVRREPENATERYTRWINSLTPDQLLTQVFTSHGPTVIMPTWFCSREWFCYVGQFVEDGQGTPEDQLFFYDHLRKGGGVHRVDECLLQYRYHQHATTHSISEETIWRNRVQFLEERVLQRWGSFTIWNAGKQGRKLYRSLTPQNRDKTPFIEVLVNMAALGILTSALNPWDRLLNLGVWRQGPPYIQHSHDTKSKNNEYPWEMRLMIEAGAGDQVVAFCDVDANKISKGFYTFEESEKRPKPRVPVLHYTEAGPPFIICVKLDLTGGGFEDNLRSLNLKEGEDYYHFS